MPPAAIAVVRVSGPGAGTALKALAGRLPEPRHASLALLADTAGAPLDIVHGIATAGFLAVIWLPWGRAIRRVVAKYDLAAR